jgi:hypothetical protein
MIRAPRLLLAGWLAALALAAPGCQAPPGTLKVAASAATGQLRLSFALPAPARHVAYVPIANTKSVRVTVAGPRYRDPSKSGSPKPLMQVVSSFNVTLDPSNAATVTVSNIPSGHNLTVKVEVFDGPLVAGVPTGKQLEALWGLVDIADGATSAATVSWKTTPAAQAIEALRRLGSEDRAVTTDAVALQGLVQTLLDTPSPGANHAVLVSGEELANALMRYTRTVDNYPLGKGYAIPAATDPVLAGVVATAASAATTKAFDLLGREVTANLKLTLGDPISAVDDTSPYGFPAIGPGDWWVFVDGVLPETRHNAFFKRFDEGAADCLTSVYLAGTAAQVAGTGAAGLGTSAAPQFNNPHQLAVDALGNLFVADTGNHRVVKVDPLGVMTVVAGTGTAGSSGDNGPATSATLRSPEGVAVDTAGNVYIADTGNHKIRVVEASTGSIKLLAGTGTPGANGDGAGATTQLSGPTNLALGGSNPTSLYFHDSGNKQIRKIPLSGTFTGSSVTSLAISDLTTENTGLAYQTVGGTEYLYYCTFSPARVIRQTMSGPSLGQRLVVAGGGEALPPLDEGVGGQKIKLGMIRALTADGNGNVYLGDVWGGATAQGRVRFRNPDRFVEVFTVLGLSGQSSYGPDGATGTECGLGTPYGLVMTGGATPALVVATSGDHRLVKVTP